jgi:hypothetical protein
MRFEHDFIVNKIQSALIEAIDKIGMPEAAEIAEHYDVSAGLLRKVLQWEENQKQSFNLKKLFDVYEFAHDINLGRKAKGKAW